MALLKIAQVGHPVLREPARALSQEELASESMQRFIDDLIETMRDANGAGLAATQVYRPVQICVIEVGDNPRYPYKPKIPLQILVNPSLTAIGEERFTNYEGCLSVPDLRGRVDRWARVGLTALDRHGKAVEREIRGISAGTYQHEVDHLEGKLFLDRVTDSTSLCTWEHFVRFQQPRFVGEVEQIVAKWGS